MKSNDESLIILPNVFLFQSERWDTSSPGPETDQPEPDTDQPVDFTVKNEPLGDSVGPDNSPISGEQEDDLTDMAMFIASAAAAVRTAGGQFQQVV